MILDALELHLQEKMEKFIKDDETYATTPGIDANIATWQNKGERKFCRYVLNEILNTKEHILGES